MIKLEPLNKDSLKTISRWLSEDKEALKRVDYSDTNNYWKLLQSPSRHGWLVLENETPIGFIDLETEGNVGFLAFFTNKSYRNRGFTKYYLEKLLNQDVVKRLKTLQAHVELDNYIGIKALKSSGFSKIGHDKDGFIIMTKTSQMKYFDIVNENDEVIGRKTALSKLKLLAGK